MRTCILLIVAMVCVYAIAMPGALSEDGYVPIPNVNDKYIQELAKWAVSEHDRQEHDSIVFNKVVGGRQKHTDSSWFDLIISGSTAGTSRNYEASVYVADSKIFGPKLLSFKVAPRNIAQ